MRKIMECNDDGTLLTTDRVLKKQTSRGSSPAKICPYLPLIKILAQLLPRHIMPHLPSISRLIR